MTTTVSLTLIENIAIITIENPPVNALSHSVRAGLMTCINDAEQNKTVAAIVIHCLGKTFVAGADIAEFGKPAQAPSLPEVLTRIDGCKNPVVAALFGNVLGGGFELAMSCHYRLAVKGTKVGLPESSLGLIPGAGGTQLLPRLVGIDIALEMTTLGKAKTVEALVNAISDSKLTSELNTPLIDQLSANDTRVEQLAQQAVSFAQQLIENKQGARAVSQMAVSVPDNVSALFAKWRTTIAKKCRGQQAPQFCIDSIENSTLLPFADGVKKEREMFINCRNSAQSRAMRQAFFAERSAAKLPENITNDSQAKVSEINSVAVIGAGTMGAGIAMCFANAGINVKLLDMSQDNVERGLATISKKYQQTLSRGLITEQQLQHKLSLIEGTCQYQDLTEVDVVVEAAFETMAVKQDIFSNLDKVCKASTILATNTSYLDIDHIAQATSRPEKVIGMHFFSPANIMKLLEVVIAKHTDNSTVKTMMALGKRIGKISVAVKVCYGFVGNRMYACYGREANMLLLEGATPEQIDNAMTDWGMAMGPLAVNDMSGIDIGYKARKDNPQLNHHPLYFAAANALVEAGRLGQKSQAGFYQYDKKTGTKSVDNSVLSIFSTIAKQHGIQQRNDISAAEIQQRLIYALINEGANILAEGIATRASDIDVIWLNGYGFPRYRGGPMHYANEIGLEKVLLDIKSLQQQQGDRYWTPSPLLVELAAKSEKFN